MSCSIDKVVLSLNMHFPEFHWNVYSVAMLLGIVGSLGYWVMAAKKDSRMVGVYLGALFGAFIGAKVVYLASEGWLHSGDETWMLHWLTGKSVTGALLFGYLGVEFAKWYVGYDKPTGDRFAVVVPAAILLGRVGCLFGGCCGGVSMPGGWLWPAVPAEMGFNACAIVVLWVLRKKGWLAGQHFHLYLMTYGAFRFAHEFLRGTEKPFFGGVVSGYQITSLLLVVVGAIGWWRRAR